MLKGDKKIKKIELYYDDDSMEEFTEEDDIFNIFVEEISMTKTLFDSANNINKKYNDLIKDLKK